MLCKVTFLASADFRNFRSKKCAFRFIIDNNLVKLWNTIGNGSYPKLRLHQEHDHFLQQMNHEVLSKEQFLTFLESGNNVIKLEDKTLQSIINLCRRTYLCRAASSFVCGRKNFPALFRNQVQLWEPRY